MFIQHLHEWQISLGCIFYHVNDPLPPVASKWYLTSKEILFQIQYQVHLLTTESSLKQTYFNRMKPNKADILKITITNMGS